jgi:hypothetical protein
MTHNEIKKTYLDMVDMNNKLDKIKIDVYNLLKKNE